MQYDMQCVDDVKKVWEFGFDAIECVSVFRGKSEKNYGVLGDIIEQGFVSSTETIIPCFRVNSDTMVHPLSFQLVWSNHVCSIWRPVAPDHFVAIGDVVQRGMESPDVSEFVCVHKSLVVPAELPFEANRSCIWPNLLEDPLPEPQLSLWRIRAAAAPSSNGEPFTIENNYFIANPSFERPKISVYALRNPLFMPTEDKVTDNTNSETLAPKEDLEEIPEELALWELPTKERKQEIEELKFDLTTITEVEHIPVHITAGKAAELYATWISSLWFAPISIRNQPIHPEILQLQYIPYYIWDTVSVSQYSLLLLEEEEWKKVSHSISSTHMDIMLNAYDDAELEPLLRNIGEWRLSEIEVAPRTKFPFFREGFIKNPNQVWNECKELIQKAEQASCESIASTYPTYKDFEVKTEFEGTEFRVILLPVYIAVFEHGNNQYRFVVNAQSGACDGTRPFNLLGGLSRLWGGIEQQGVYTGLELRTKDSRNAAMYNPQFHYLLFPSSKRSLWSNEIGWIKLQNKSDKEIPIRGKERNGKGVGIIYPLPPGDSPCFPYKGNWVIEIDGDPSMICLKAQSPIGGNSFANLLGMV